MTNKILTISISAYNVEKYIESALESLIILEKMHDLEILIINDGSTDKTLTIAKEYAKKYQETFKIIDKKNGGYGSTINTAIKLARGKYFKQLDGDDWFDKENLKEFLDFLRTSNADCIYSPYWKMYQSKGRKELEKPYIANLNAITAKDIAMYAFTFKTKIFKENHIWITENCFYTDCEYNVKTLMHVNKIEYYDKPIYIYRLGETGQSVSKEGWMRHFGDHNKVTLEIMSYYEQNKDRIVFQNRSAIENYISNVYKTNFSIALELADNVAQEQYKTLDLMVKSQFPQFYQKRNFKMRVLEKCKYRIWRIIREYHRLFENMIFD